MSLPLHEVLRVGQAGGEQAFLAEPFQTVRVAIPLNRRYLELVDLALAASDRAR
jgi:hypothetical protein